MQNLLVVGICLALGLLLQRVRAFPAQHAASALNAFVVYVALPALILVAVPRLELGAGLLAPVLIPWLVLGVTAGAVVAMARARGWSRGVRGALLMVVPLANTSFLGIPLTEAWLGRSAVPWAVLYDQLGSFLALTIYGSFVIATHAPGATRRPRAAELARRVVAFPPFLALLGALVVKAVAPEGLPPTLTGALGAIAASLVPTVMVAVGLQWRVALAREELGPTAFALIVKLALAPVVAWVALRALGLHGAAADASVFEAAMGPMITAGALAIAADLEPRLVAAVVGYGTVLSLATTAVVHAMLLPL